MNDDDAPVVDRTVRIVTIIVLGFNLMVAIVMLGVVAVMTDRNIRAAEVMVLVGALAIGAMGGLNWALLRRHRHWRINLERENGRSSDEPDPHGGR